jgi:hypothetical protein
VELVKKHLSSLDPAGAGVREHLTAPDARGSLDQYDEDIGGELRAELALHRVVDP